MDARCRRDLKKKQSAYGGDSMWLDNGTGIGNRILSAYGMDFRCIKKTCIEKTKCSIVECFSRIWHVHREGHYVECLE